MQFGGGGGPSFLFFFFSFIFVLYCCFCFVGIRIDRVFENIFKLRYYVLALLQTMSYSVTRKSQNHGRNTFYSWYHTVILSYVSIPYNNSLKTFCKIVYFLLQDFRVERFRWTRALCNHDSDGDGISNGAELGDPDCTWRVGQAILQSAIGHPGIVFYPMWGMGKCIPIYYVATITCSG